MKSTIKRQYRECRSNKTSRPFIEKQAMHITLKSSFAKGMYSLANKRMATWLRDYVPRLARNCSVRLYHFSINGSHLHFVLMAQSKRGLSKFLRALGGMIPRRVLGAERGRAKNIKFWDRRPYSRVLSWGKEFRNVLRYVQRNVLEAIGKIHYVDRTLVLPNREREYIEKSFKLERWERENWLSLQGTLF